ncbi:3-deoxy-7-phosphoheptulonate synthase [Pelosinus sp. UFO1]|uniref:3-deoxy-7-phosphoheptulonate synthase n=1 Tax=Pelosinus sp. UFO1 TaxID=484770 RepID=UPI0004D1F704|nr:3-deoxy-7-phosphoheptulonate synthase [Pelosinus sp. UFO1]AIF51566.1 phospho-2-dehydro-3-deoxyheptonate aldolase [Pelosinus sp. UFO1]
MIIVMTDSTDKQIEHVMGKFRQHEIEVHCLNSYGKTIITAIGDSSTCNPASFERMPGVEKVISIVTPFKLVSREFRRENTIVTVGNAVFGDKNVSVIAGPCAVEGYEQLLEAALAVKKAGACMLRGGAYKPRTSPYSFQGLEKEGLAILKAVSLKAGLPVVSEVTDPRTVEMMSEYVDMLQIGTRNMQNFVLLKEVAKSGKPILLKRGLSATMEEWLMAAEYIMAGGNENIVLCERGIRTFETYTRNTLDLNAIPLIKHLSHLPVIVDPSHGTGNWRLVNPMSKASLGAGADGLIIEVHPCPEEAVSDGQQSLTPHNFEQMMRELQCLAMAIDRVM